MSDDPIITVRRYDEAWAQEDNRSRLRILAEIWADDGCTSIRTFPMAFEAQGR